MNYKMMGRFIAQIISIEAVFMLPAMFISWGYAEEAARNSFFVTIVIIAGLALLLFGICRKTERIFGAQEGLVCVGLSWIVMSLLGCLPFILSGEIPAFIDAFFEIVSGFTTTGASILSNVEGLSKGMLYWRSFSHWLGGMGVLVFLLAIAPGGGKGKGFTMHLLRAESPGPDVGKLVPKMKQTAMILYLIYIGMTVINVVCLLLGKMPLLDALCTAFATAGTGGFGIKNDSLASYSPYLQNVTTIFMFLFGISFSCYFLLLMRQIKGVFLDEELRFYVGLTVAAIVAVAFDVRAMYGTLGETIRHAAFQVSSIITTTGFGTTDFDAWPSFSKSVLLLLMMVGACAGSTGGGIKCARVLLLFKNLGRNISQLLNPQKVRVIRNNGRVVDERVLENINGYMAAYIIIIVLSVLVISLDGFDFETNLSAVLACFNNIGPGMAAVGPTCNYGAYSWMAKLVLSLVMLAGRLEIFPILALFSKGTWFKR